MRPDEELMAALAKGDQTAFDELYSRHQFGLKKYVKNWYYEATAEVDDVVQDVWLRVYRYAGSYDPTRSKVFTWICNMSHKEFRRILRKDLIRRDAYLGYKGKVVEENPELVDKTGTPDAQVEKAEEYESDMTALQAAAMHHGARAVDIMADVLDGKFYKVIGEKHGISLQRVGQIVKKIEKTVQSFART
jgi:RNA polymerase sigma factor (sigma-70 family)